MPRLSLSAKGSRGSGLAAGAQLRLFHYDVEPLRRQVAALSEQDWTGGGTRRHAAAARASPAPAPSHGLLPAPSGMPTKLAGPSVTLPTHPPSLPLCIFPRPPQRRCSEPATPGSGAARATRTHSSLGLGPSWWAGLGWAGRPAGGWLQACAVCVCVQLCRMRHSTPAHPWPAVDFQRPGRPPRVPLPLARPIQAAAGAFVAQGGLMPGAELHCQRVGVVAGYQDARPAHVCCSVEHAGRVPLELPKPSVLPSSPPPSDPGRCRRVQHNAAAAGADAGAWRDQEAHRRRSAEREEAGRAR